MQEIPANVGPSREDRPGVGATRPHGECEVHVRSPWLLIEGQQRPNVHELYVNGLASSHKVTTPGNHHPAPDAENEPPRIPRLTLGSAGRPQRGHAAGRQVPAVAGLSSAHSRVCGARRHAHSPAAPRRARPDPAEPRGSLRPASRWPGHRDGHRWPGGRRAQRNQVRRRHFSVSPSFD